MKKQGLGTRGWGLRVLLLTGLAVTLATPCFCQEPLPNWEHSELKLAVRVYDYAQMPEWRLARAEKRAAEVFRHAGAEIVWSEWPVAGNPAQTIGVDDQPITTRYFVLNIVTRQKAARVASGMEPLGFAMPCSAEDPVCRAYVFYDRVEDLARNEGLPTDQIFGYVLAHELGHLFLGPHCHTPDGIMRGMWGSKDLRYTTRGFLHFGLQQAQVIREVVGQRMRFEGGPQLQTAAVPTTR
jgi:hypothetical protein